MRFRSATTSGAPGVEKARNTVRQKATGKCLTIAKQINSYLSEFTEMF